MDDDAAGLGLTLAYPEKGETEDVFEIWYEGRFAWSVFTQCHTQWRQSFSGMTGLDYNVVFKMMWLDGFDRKKQARVMRHIQMIEEGALRAIRKIKARSTST